MAFENFNDDTNCLEEDKELVEFKKNANKFNKVILNKPDMIGRVLVRILAKINTDENDFVDLKTLNEELSDLIESVESK